VKFLSIFALIKTTFKRFNEDKCANFAITISYFTFLCTIPLVALLAFVSTKILGNSELAFNSLNIFSDEFFSRFNPAFFDTVKNISANFANLGLFGLIGSFIGASLLFSNLIYSINFIFKANYQKSFVYNRLMEYLIMFIMGIIMLASLFITAIWTALNRSIRESSIVANHINPNIISIVNNFFLQYLLPFALVFFVFFSLYKFIPEIKVHTKAAAIAAVIGALLWEVFKRIFVFYVAHFSAIGVVMDRLVKGTLTSIIFFLLWITFSLVIFLWSAELASVLNEQQHEKLA